MTIVKRALGLGGTAFALALLPAPATAQSLPTASVSYADLDVSTAAGAAALNRRIEGAAERICRVHLTSSNGRWGPLNYNRCLSMALASARPQVEQVVARANGIRLARREPITIRGR